MESATFSLARQLEHAPADLKRVVAALSQGEAPSRADLAGLPSGALAFALAAALRAGGKPFLAVVPDTAAASKLEADLAFFLGEARASEVLSFPAIETTPFVDIAPDRRVAMDRLTALFHLAHGLPTSVVVAPIAALVRKVPPAAALKRASTTVSIGDHIDRGDLITLLGIAGYLRVPLVEDPGTFAVRGAVVDVYPPRSELPFRIELDDDLVAAIKTFSPEDQRTQQEVESVLVHPVRDTLLGPEELMLAKERVSDLCDHAGMPSSKRRQVVEDIGTGRSFIGLDAFLPAFYDELQTLFAFLPKGTRIVLVDPPALERELADELDKGAREREARVEQRSPTFALDKHYLPAATLEKVLEKSAITVVHAVAFHGKPEDEEPTGLPILTPPGPDALLRAGATDQSALASELHAARTAHAEDTLAPLASWLTRFLEEAAAR